MWESVRVTSDLICFKCSPLKLQRVCLYIRCSGWHDVLEGSVSPCWSVLELSMDRQQLLTKHICIHTKASRLLRLFHASNLWATNRNLSWFIPAHLSCFSTAFITSSGIFFFFLASSFLQRFIHLRSLPYVLSGFHLTRLQVVRRGQQKCSLAVSWRPAPPTFLLKSLK